MTKPAMRIDHPSHQLYLPLNLVRTNLDVCFVFSSLAKYEFEAGRRGQARRTFDCARRSYDAMLRFLNKRENQDTRSVIQMKLAQPYERLAFLCLALKSIAAQPDLPAAEAAQVDHNGDEKNQQIRTGGGNPRVHHPRTGQRRERHVVGGMS